MARDAFYAAFQMTLTVLGESRYSNKRDSRRVADNIDHMRPLRLYVNVTGSVADVKADDA